MNSMPADLDKFMIHQVRGHSFIYSKVYCVAHTTVDAGATDRQGCYSNEAYKME